jgi:hypothetical protein
MKPDATDDGKALLTVSVIECYVAMLNFYVGTLAKKSKVNFDGHDQRLLEYPLQFFPLSTDCNHNVSFPTEIWKIFIWETIRVCLISLVSRESYLHI